MTEKKFNGFDSEEEYLQATKKVQFLDKVWDALDFSAGTEWFKKVSNGNMDLDAVAVVEDMKTAFIQFTGENRYLLVVGIDEPIDQENPFLAEMSDAAGYCVSKTLGFENFSYDHQQFEFWTLDTPDSTDKKWWIMTYVSNVEKAKED